MRSPENLKLAFVIPYFYPAWQYGGQPKSAYELARALIRRGHSVTVLTTDSGGDRRLSLDAAGCQYRSVEGIDIYYFRNLSNYLAFQHRVFLPARLFLEIDSRIQGSDVIHIHELRSALSVLAHHASCRLKIPYMLSTHGGLRKIGKVFTKSVFDLAWGRKILADTSIFVAVTPAEQSEAREAGVAPDKIAILPNAISKDDYAVLPSAGAFRSRWQIGPGRVVLFLGRLHWVKGADLLVEALKSVQSSFPGTRLVIAGPDDGQGQYLRELTSRCGLTNFVTFTGYLDSRAKLEALVDSDVLVVPSRSEVFALVALEAMVCGTPVLLSSACGLFPVPSPQEGVRFFKRDDLESLASELCEILSEEYRHDVAGGRRFVEKEFDSEAVARKAELLYYRTVRSEVGCGQK